MALTLTFISLIMIGAFVGAFLIFSQMDEIKNLKSELELQNKWISDLVDALENK